MVDGTVALHTEPRMSKGTASLAWPRMSLSRTTTQPAIIHPYYQAEVYAKVSGYLKELNTDIGQPVDAGSVLGTIAVPEMGKSREKREATVRRLQADEKRAAAEITVAQANTESAAASLGESLASLLREKGCQEILDGI